MRNARTFNWIVLILLFGIPLRAQDAVAPGRLMQQIPTIDVALLDRLLMQAPQERVAKPDDTLEVSVYGVREFSFRERITNSGDISLPLVGSLHVAGEDLHAITSAIAEKLISTGTIRDPQVDVTFYSEPSAAFTINGEVYKPGAYPAIGVVTLDQALAVAGGLRDTAHPVVTLIRRSLSGPVAIPIHPAANGKVYTGIRIWGGDRIVVNKVGEFYIVGAVAKQGAVALKSSSPTTVLQAIALAGGAGFQADLDDASIVRNSANGPTVIPLDLRHLSKSHSADVTLEANDVLFVPTNSMKALIKGGGAAVVIALSNSLSYFGR